MALEGLPSWALEIQRRIDHLDLAGLNGLLGAHEVTMSLGEALARGQLAPEELAAWLKSQLAPATTAKPKADALKPMTNEELLAQILEDPQAFWYGFHNRVFPGLIMAPIPLPKISAKTYRAARQYRLLLIPLHAQVTQDVYPAHWVKSNWGRYIDADLITHQPLSNRWALVETIASCDWNNSVGYGGGNDPLARALDLQKRFGTTWDHIMATICPKVAKICGKKRQAVRLPTAEEWNYVGNVLLELNRMHATTFPDLGSVNRWEWCQNAYGSGSRLVVGDRDDGGLAGVHRFWSDGANDNVAFRLLAVLMESLAILQSFDQALAAQFLWQCIVYGLECATHRRVG